MKVIGLMSGTSLDGVDAALVEIYGSGAHDFRWRVLGFVTRPYEETFRSALARALEEGAPAELSRLHARLGERFAEAVVAVCEEAGADRAQVDLVGSHGQTFWHGPPESTTRGHTLQLGDPATVAERTGIAVVSDFRSRDVAAGGHGAPLVPFADRLLFSEVGLSRAVQNLGGMANVTWLPPADSDQTPLAFDTGPGVALIDEAARLATGGAWTMDRDGALASRGTVDAALLERLLDHPFFDREPPRSTGRELFGPGWVRELAGARTPGREEEWVDLVATLTALTAESVARAYRRWVVPRGVDEVILTGGGARNPALQRALERALDPLTIREADALGLDPDAREAVAFAVLAWAHVTGLPGNVPGSTGASGPRILGSYTPGAGPPFPEGA